MGRTPQILIELTSSHLGDTPKDAEANSSSENWQRNTLAYRISLENLSRRVWRSLKNFRISLYPSNSRERVFSIPALFGVASAAIFPKTTLAILYALILTDRRIVLSRDHDAIQ